VRRSLRIAPGKAAALFIDLQEEHRQHKRYLVAGFEAIIANVRDLQRAARRAGIPVLHAAYVVDPADRKLRPFHPVMADGSSATMHISSSVHPCSSTSADVAYRAPKRVARSIECAPCCGGRL